VEISLDIEIAHVICLRDRSLTPGGLSALRSLTVRVELWLGRAVFEARVLFGGAFGVRRASGSGCLLGRMGVWT
jgi:hypothetical protein